MRKVALVVGGTGGIGRAVVDMLLGTGAEVYATYRREGERVEALEKSFPACHLVRCDIRSQKEIDETVASIVAAHAAIDVVVNATAAPLKLKRIDALSEAGFLEDLQVYALGAFHLYKAILPLLKKQERGGLLIQFLTAALNQPAPRMSSYVGAKGALRELARSAVAELQSYPIRIVSISPSYVETPLLGAFPRAFLALQKEKLPKKRFIQPEEIARLVKDIIEDPARYPSGAEIPAYEPAAHPL